MDRERIERRLAELRQALEDTIAQAQNLQGAITELERYWLPLADESEPMITMGELADAIGGKQLPITIGKDGQDEN